MPQDIHNRYFVPGVYDDRTISPTSRYPHIRTRNSTRAAPVPYPIPETLMTRVDNPHGNEWYRDPSEDLYLRDLLFVVRMQTARRMEERTCRFPRCDLVLDRLIVEGTFDCVAPDYSSFVEEMAMHHSSAMVQRLLMRIECMESEVRLLCGFQRGCFTDGFLGLVGERQDRVQIPVG